MDVYKYIAESNPIGTQGIIESFGYEHANTPDMGLSQLVARLGFAYAISPVPDGYVTPETPDANRINYTAGIGYNIKKHFTINASFLFTTFKREGKNLETNLEGTYKTNVVIPGLSVNYKF